MSLQEKRALFLAGASTLTVAEVREWSEEVEPTVWESVPKGEGEPPDGMQLLVVAFEPGPLGGTAI